MADRCTRMAAAISYYALFSLFPLLLAAIAISGFILKSPTVSDQLVDTITRNIAVSRDLVEETLEGVVQARGPIGIIGILGLLWSGSAVFANLRESLNIAWGAKGKRGFFKQKAIDIGMIFLLGLLLLLSLVATAAIQFFRRLSDDLAASIMNSDSLRQGLAKLFSEPIAERLADFLPSTQGVLGDIFWNTMNAVVPPAFTFLVFLLAFKVLPNVTVRWRHAALGAVFSAAGFEALKNLFAWYAESFATYNAVYGSIGTIVALLSFFYLAGVVFLLGAEIGAQAAAMPAREELAWPLVGELRGWYARYRDKLGDFLRGRRRGSGRERKQETGEDERHKS